MYLSVNQIADKLQVNPKSIYDWVSKKRFPPPNRFGRLLRWKESDIEEAVAKGLIGRSQAPRN